ncbi:MAG: dephospho-CoA kinase [Ruminococcus sp.]|nr:dephospho-CoA kinase [Ruminococcus sp.]
MSEPLIIGLTGQSGAGKTTVSRIFAAEGFSVVNADEISRKVTEKGSPCLNRLAECFGGDILFPDGSLDRKKLGSMVFSDRAMLQRLDGIIYPYINEEIYLEIKRLAAEGARLILLDAPTLFEAGADKLCGVTVSVTAREDIRERRITERDNISSEEAKKRFRSQLSEEFFTAHSDHIITNDRSPQDLERSARETAEKIKEKIHAGDL